VEGWGWDGQVAAGVASTTKQAAMKIAGRKPGARDLTPESLEEFECQGAEVWKKLEALREEWEPRTKGAMALS
jgi:3-keto steroid reductase